MQNIYEGENMSRLDMQEQMRTWSIPKNSRQIDEREAISLEKQGKAASMFAFVEDKSFYVDFGLWLIWVLFGGYINLK